MGLVGREGLQQESCWAASGAGRGKITVWGQKLGFKVASNNFYQSSVFFQMKRS